MSRPLAICFSLFFVLGMFQMDGEAQAQAPKTITNSIGMKLVLIPKGTFLLVSPSSEAGSEGDERHHEVTLTQDYYLGAFEVTQAQYKKVMGENPSDFQGNNAVERHPETGRVVRELDTSNHPVEQVSWEDAVKFCGKLSDLPEEKKAGREYRLPTEAEWEYACRAGSKSAYSFGESSKSLGDHAWFGGNSKNKTHPVGEKNSNAWVLYDMHGNVSEWCGDWYGEYPKSAVSDPVGPKEGSIRVIRGGGWGSVAADCRSASRDGFVPSFQNISDGFRVALGSSGIPK
jgi:formylglycine-generating enzyme required for sulfatase activity